MSDHVINNFRIIFEQQHDCWPTAVDVANHFGFMVARKDTIRKALRAVHPEYPCLADLQYLHDHHNDIKPPRSKRYPVFRESIKSPASPPPLSCSAAARVGKVKVGEPLLGAQ